MATEVCEWLSMCVYVDGGMIREEANNCRQGCNCANVV